MLQRKTGLQQKLHHIKEHIFFELLKPHKQKQVRTHRLHHRISTRLGVETVVLETTSLALRFDNAMVAMVDFTCASTPLCTISFALCGKAIRYLSIIFDAVQPVHAQQALRLR